MRQEVMSFLRGLLLHWKGGGKIIALSSLTERGKKRKPERKNIGTAANLIKMLVAGTYGLHYSIRLTVVTPIGLDQRFLADGGGRPIVLLRPKDHEDNLQVDFGNPLVWAPSKHIPAFSTSLYTSLELWARPGASPN